MSILLKLTNSQIKIDNDSELISYIKKYGNSNIIETTRLLRSYFQISIPENELYLDYEEINI